MAVRQEDKEFIAHVYKYAFVGLMLDWIRNDMKGDTKELVARFSTVIHGSITNALEQVRTDKNHHL